MKKLTKKLLIIPIILFIALFLYLSLGLIDVAPVNTEPPVSTPTPAPPVEEKSEEQLIKDAAANILSSMTEEEKLFQLFVILPDALPGVTDVTVSDEAVHSAIKENPVGGMIYSTPSLISRQQAADMISGIQSYSKLGLFITIDEEGGSVTRLGKNPEMCTTLFPSMAEIGDTGDTENAYNIGHTIGTEIAELGFNLDFAPVADVNSNPANTVIGSRAFSSDPLATADMVEACVKGFADSGMLCTLKHFPGHGDTYADSHYGAAETSKSLAELYECELIPFIAGINAGAQFVMIAHITAPNVTQESIPATLSYELVTGLLRGKLGFEGIIITDSMSMKAITDTYSSGEAAVKAIQAGCDMILSPEDLSDAVNGLLNAVHNGDIPQSRIDDSVLRILETKLRSGIIDMDIDKQSTAN